MGIRQGSEIDNILNETEVGQVIAKNKMMYIIVAAVAIISVFAYGGFSQWNKTNSEKEFELARVFQTKYQAMLLEKDLKIEKMILAFKELEASLAGSSTLLYSALVVADFLIEKEKMIEAESILNNVYKTEKNTKAISMIGMRLSAVLEDLKKYDQGIIVLEKLASLKIKAYEGKVYLDLARVYSLKGNHDKAKRNFQFVIDNSTETDIVKLARIGLQQLK